MRKKVAHVIYDLATAGAQTVVMNYIRYMNNDDDFEPYIVVGNSYSGLQYEIEALDNKYNVIFANFKPNTSSSLFRPLYNWINYQKALYRALKSINPDIIHTHLTKILPFASLPVLLLRKKWVHTLHSDPYAIPTRFFLFARFIFHVFSPKVVGVTENQVDKAKKRYSLKNISVVHNGILLDNYRITEPKESIREELGISKQSFVIGTVGRLDKVKNYPFLIKIFASVAQNNPDARLLFVGDGPEKKHLIEQIEELQLNNKVLFTGQRKDVERMYQAMNVFVMTSFFESSSIVTVEAQVSGLRCVIADTIPDNVIVTSDKVSTLSLNDSIENWVNAINNNYPRRKQVSDVMIFSIEHTICELKDVYNSL